MKLLDVHVADSGELKSGSLCVTTDENYLVHTNGNKLHIYPNSTLSRPTILDTDSPVLRVWPHPTDPSSVFGLLSAGRILKWTLPHHTPEPVFDFKPAKHPIVFAEASGHDAFNVAVLHRLEHQFLLAEHRGCKKHVVQIPKIDFVADRPLIARNGLLVATVATVHKTVNNKSVQNQRICFVTDDGCRKQHANVDEDRAITTIACHPAEMRVVTGDVSGRVGVWQMDTDFRFVVRIFHWHTTAVTALAFEAQTPVLYSAAGENVLVKWDLQASERVGTVPRLGATVRSLTATGSLIVCQLDNNSIEMFSSAMQERGQLRGINAIRSIAWHHKSLLLDEGPHLSFFSPETNTTAVVCDLMQENVVLGDGTDNEKITSSVVSRTGEWIATAERSRKTDEWSAPPLLKLWHYSDLTGQFALRTVIKEPHFGKIVPDKLFFVRDDALVTCGEDGRAKLWSLGADGSWQCEFVFAFRGLAPACAAASADESVLAIAFGHAVTLWRMREKTLVASLVDPKGRAAITSMTFGAKAAGSVVLVTSRDQLSAWNILSATLMWTIKMTEPVLFPVRGSSLTGLRIVSGIILLGDGLQIRAVHAKQDVLHVCGRQKLSGEVELFVATQAAAGCVRLSKLSSEAEADKENEAAVEVDEAGLKMYNNMTFTASVERFKNMSIRNTKEISVPLSKFSRAFVDAYVEAPFKQL